MQKIIPSLTIAALTAITIGVCITSVARAQEGGGGYYGSRSPATASCPQLESRVIPAPPAGGVTKGVMYYSDMSGVSVINSTVAADGSITGTVKSVSGNGPAGPVTGRRDKNGVNVHVAGTGCSDINIALKRWVPGTPSDRAEGSGG